MMAGDTKQNRTEQNRTEQHSTTQQKTEQYSYYYHGEITDLFRNLIYINQHFLQT